MKRGRVGFLPRFMDGCYRRLAFLLPRGLAWWCHMRVLLESYPDDECGR